MAADIFVEAEFVRTARGEAKQTESWLSGGEECGLQSPARRTGQLVLKDPNPPMVFGEEFVWAQFGLRASSDRLLQGERGGVQVSPSSAIWFQPVWGPRAFAQPEVTFLHLGGGPWFL